MESVLLSQREEGYYGRNDLKPMSFGRKVCVYITLFVLSPILVVYMVLHLLAVSCMMCCMSMNQNQISTAKVLGFEGWYKVPGKKLEVGSAGQDTSDIKIPTDFVNERGELDTCKRISLRKSIECTIQEHLCKGPYGAKIQNDGDKDQPHYLLHAWTEPFDPTGDEVWCSHARTATWAGIYSWSGQLPPTGWTSWNQAINLSNVPDALGYIYLFEISNPEFYNGRARIKKVGGKTVNAPDHTPDTEGKIFARYGYGQVKYMGDFPQGDPDAYIFKGKTLQEAQLKVLHTYRVMKPSLV